MNLITVEKIAKTYGFKSLFKDVSFGIEQGEKTALLARNGTGKTTLLKIIAGLEQPDDGLVTRNSEIRISMLSQAEDFDKNQSALEVMMSCNHPAVKAYRDYQIALTQGADEKVTQKLVEAVEQTNAWSIEEKAQQLLSVFGITDVQKKIGIMSGGQLKRLSLASVLLEEPDLILMDEPTNHLDTEMIEWLENYLKNLSSALFLVTHDRYFMDRVCNSIIELENHRIYKYKGNYSYFLQKINEREEQEVAEQSRAKNRYRKELEWMRRQPKARTTKSKSRIDAFDEIAEKANQKKHDTLLKAHLNPERMGSKILELIKVAKSFDDKEIISNFTYSFNKNDKIGFVGKNGSGKSTLLNMITGKLEVDSGKVIVGETIRFGYYHQQGITFKPGQRIIEYIREVAEYIPLEKGKVLTAAQMLENFLFPRSVHFQEIEQLSGGEKKRLYLLSIFMKNPNFLILDEPTNDLDIYTIQALETYLQNFNGCLIVVSHDRFFLDKTIDRIFAFDHQSGHIVDYPGVYSDYYLFKKEQDLIQQKRLSEEKKAIKTRQAEPKTQTKQKGLSYKERQEFIKLEKKIESLESEKSVIEQALYEAGADAEKTIELSEQLDTIESELEEKMNRWIELSEREGEG